MATMRSRPRFDTTALNTQMMMTNTEYFTLPRHSFSKKLAEELTSATAVVMHASATTTPKITVTADPALLLQPASGGAVDSYFLSNDLDPDGKYAMFVLRPWKNLSQHLQAIVDTADYVNKTYGLTPVFVALEPTRDLEINRTAASMLTCRTVVLPAPRDEQLTIGMMQKMRVIVSMRLHALIFASSVGAPLAAISYDPKVTGFMAYLGQEHCMELADVTKPALCRLVEDTMQAAQPYSTDRLKTLAAENETAARELLEELK